MTPTTERIAATVLTGFLGAGKSTLLRRVLTESHGQKIAVIENEFGGADIDSEIIVSGGGEQIIQLSNGCVCCTIRDDLRAALMDLAERRRTGELDFDRVMIETTGLADPGPVVQTFFLDDEIAARYRPDAILTLVDAKHAMDQLTDRLEARRQVGFADHIFISKTDLVGGADLAILENRLGRINAKAPRKNVLFGHVALSEVFDLRGFNLDAELDLPPACSDTDDHDHVEGRHHHRHDDIKSFVFRSERPFHPSRFGQFMNALVNSHGPRMLRYKGVLHMWGAERKSIFQGVHQLMSREDGLAWKTGEARASTLVFIGVDLPEALFLRSLNACLV